MPDFIFDWDQPYPDQIIEAMRLRVLDAVADLATHTDQLQGALLLCLTAFDFAQTVLDTIGPLQQQVVDQSAALEALSARVAALETPPEAPA